MKVRVADKILREAEITLPLFRKHVLDHGTSYMRVTETTIGLRLTTICIGKKSVGLELGAHDSFELEVNEHYKFDERSEEAYTLGTGEYASSKEEFKAALDKLRERLATL